MYTFITLIIPLVFGNQFYSSYNDNSQVSYLPQTQQAQNSQNQLNQQQQNQPITLQQYPHYSNQFSPLQHSPSYWNWRQAFNGYYDHPIHRPHLNRLAYDQLARFPWLWRTDGAIVPSYHLKRNVWWRCTEDSLTCFHNLIKMVLKASQKPVCKSHCAQKCKFPQVPCRISMLQHFVNRIPRGLNHHSAQAPNVYLAGCRIPRFDGQKEVLANIIIQKARTCRVDIGKIERLERIVMLEYETFVDCLRQSNSRNH